ncbi:L,D-transpeptidase [Oceaniglobus ichthyenteri]|uniref:L,D-transpeptidase n=1 Tax=Oceaniglobus ichthyenteri TaxID=2136177 RepID=UPI001F0BD7BC|nr:L,D-transpeptidase [Oceaniglobus ichthyenteri]
MKEILYGHMSRIVAIALISFGILFTPIAVVAQTIKVTVDLSEQRMVVQRLGVVVGDWPVSTARAGKVTPVGSFQPQFMKREHYSSLYNNAPMPYSIFFKGNYAIHGTTQIKSLGRPASAGCVRLHPDHAAQLFAMVRDAGMGDTMIRIQR